MKTASTSLEDGFSLRIEVLEEAETDCSCFDGVVPEVLHSVHEFFLEGGFVGETFGFRAFFPPLAGTDVAHVFVICACEALVEAFGW